MRNFSGLWKNSLIFLIGSLVAGFGGYVFQLLLGRFLSVEEYGEFESLFSLLSIFSVPTAAASFLAVKYSSFLLTNKKTEDIWNLAALFGKHFLIFGFLFFAVFIIAAPVILKFLKINNFSVILVFGFLVWFGFFNSSSKGFLQGFQNFKYLSLTSVFEVFLKIIFAWATIYLGFGILGVFSSILLASFLSFLFSLIPFKKFRPKIVVMNFSGLNLKQSGGYLNIFKSFGFLSFDNNVVKYIFLSFFSLLSFSTIHSLDIVLVKHFFSAFQAGMYGALSVAGKIILFVVSPIASVMLPMINEAGGVGENKDLLKKSVFLTFGCGAVILSFFWFFPDFIIRKFFGDKYIAAVPYLFWYGLAMFLASFVNLLTIFALFFQKKFGVAAVGFGVILQAVLVFWFHQSFGQIIFAVLVSLAVSLLFLSACFVNFFRVEQT